MAPGRADNALDIVPGVALLPWEWSNLGAAFAGRRSHARCVASRAALVLRRGGDEEEEYGNVLEASGDVGFNLRAADYAFHVSAASLAFKAGADDPLRAQAAAGGTLAGLRLAAAQRVGEDRYLGFSYDAGSRRPSLVAAWSGDAGTERASLTVALDPVDRAATVRAAVIFPGPEWRSDVWDWNTRRVQAVQVRRVTHGAWALWLRGTHTTHHHIHARAPQAGGGGLGEGKPSSISARDPEAACLPHDVKIRHQMCSCVASQPASNSVVG